MNTFTAAQTDVAKIFAEIRKANEAEGLGTLVSNTGNVWMGKNTIWYEIQDHANGLLWWVMINDTPDRYGFYTVFAEDERDRAEKDQAE